MKKWRFFLFGVLAFLALFFLSVVVYYAGRPAPVEMREEIYPCVVYYRRVHIAPRPMVAHIVTVDLTCDNIRLLVTPPEKGNKDTPLRARTTSQFAGEFGVQVAINGDGFTPWWSNALWDYYPHLGDPVRPLGYAASLGKGYGELSPRAPVLYINSRNEASFGKPLRKVYNALSGMSWLVQNKQPVQDLNDTRTAPRTAVGLDGPATRLILIVVDGRQPFYSEGATIAELAELMMFYGGDNAIMLDGGGSSTLAIEMPGEGIRVMNSPIDLFLPGRERPVGNHLGIFAK